MSAHEEEVCPVHETSLTLEGDRNIVIARTFNGPARIVFEAYTRPELVARWWAPQSHGVSIVACDADVRPGGSYRYVLRVRAKQEIAFSGQYPGSDATLQAGVHAAVRTDRVRRPAWRPGHHHHGDVRRTRRRNAFPSVADRLPDAAAPRHDHRVRHGKRHARDDGSARGTGGLLEVTSSAARRTADAAAPTCDRRPRRPTADLPTPSGSTEAARGA